MKDARMIKQLIILTFVFVIMEYVFAQRGFLNIACGATSNNTDEKGLYWVSDKNYIAIGESSTLKSSSTFPYYFRSLRSFPKPIKKACYTIPISTTSRYLLRLWFSPNLDRGTIFKYSIETQNMLSVNDVSVGQYYEHILEISGRILYVCLIRGSDQTDPFISAIQLIKLLPGMYLQAKQGTLLSMMARKDAGNRNGQEIRFPYDQFDRIWSAYKLDPKAISTSKTISTTNTKNFPPSIVMQTAQTLPPAAVIQVSAPGSCKLSLLLLYCAQFGNASATMFTASFNDVNTIVNLEHEYSAVEVDILPKFVEVQCAFVLQTTSSSENNAVLNAFEVYQVIHSDKSTDIKDVEALADLKKRHKLNIQSWISDPCYIIPWDHVSCDGTRISGLYLSGINLTGTFPSSISTMTSLKELDLSNNKLKGPLPDMSSLTLLEKIDIHNNDLNGTLPSWISQLKHLQQLLIQNNDFSGEVPRELVKQLKIFRFTGNPKLVIPSESRKHQRNFIIGLTVSGVLLILLALYLLRVYKKKKDLKNLAEDRPIDNRGCSGVLLTNSRDIRSFSMDEMSLATQKFSKKIGHGGFGSVFYGKLSNGKEIAVKVLSISSEQGKDEYLNELQLLTQVNHKNVVRVLGYCNDADELMIVYEYLQRGSLKDYLRGLKSKHTTLSWRSRLKVALDVSIGLEYLHIHCKPKIIHRDLKSANILLDNNYNGKISDLGLSKEILNGVSHLTTTVKGTHGYLDPEYFNTQMLTEKSDLYSFGVVLLEIVCGRQPIDTTLPDEEVSLIKWVKTQMQYDPFKSASEYSKRKSIAKRYLSKFTTHYSEMEGSERLDSIIDKRLTGKIYSKRSVEIVIELALRCVRLESWFRPSVSVVVGTLNEAIKEEDSAAMKALEKHAVKSTNSYGSSTSTLRDTQEIVIATPPSSPESSFKQAMLEDRSSN